MTEVKLDKAAVETVLASARNALANEPELSWVKKSSLFERAYLLGLYFGLREITKEGSLQELIRDFQKTMWERQADDTFSSTTVGYDYLELNKATYSDGSESDDTQQLIEKLRKSIDEQDHHWRFLIREAQELLNTIRNAENDQEKGKHERYQHIETLEDVVRKIALLETDHRLEKRLEK